MRLFFLIICSLLGTNSNEIKGQNFDLPFKLGVIIDYGTHVQRIGLQASFYTTFRAHEFVFEYQSYYNFRNLGPKISYWENTFKAAYKFGFGPEKNLFEESPFFNVNIDHLNEKYSLGYGLNFYLNKIGNQQSTGTVSFNVGRLNFNFENDLWGNTHGRDRFRTGGFLVTYADNRFLYSIASILWTGDAKDKNVTKHLNEIKYPARFGYKDLSDSLFGKSSHGILFASISYAPEDLYRQHFTTSIGIDSEKVRNFFQNKIIHDMYFLPKSLIKSQNLHVPMLDDNGEPYLFENGQVLKKNQLFFQTSANGFWTY